MDILIKNSSSYTTPIPVNFNVFRKHNQRHRYGTIRDYQELLVQLTIPKRITKPVFHVIGHSLDKTDHNILKHIFLINKNAKINLYYHNEESQENLINNITEIIGEEELHYRMHELVRNRVYYLKEGIKNAIRRRQLPADVDVELAAEAINLMLVGYVLAVRKDKAFWTLNRYYRLVDACLISLVSIKRDMNSY